MLLTSMKRVVSRAQTDRQTEGDGANRRLLHVFVVNAPKEVGYSHSHLSRDVAANILRQVANYTKLLWHCK